MNITVKLFPLFFLSLLSLFSFAIDTDHDGLPDAWELENGRDPLVADYQISVTDTFACLLADGSITCWGDNDDGQLDAPQLDNIKQIDTAYNAVTSFPSSGEVTVDGSVACALHDSRITCWGSNEFGLLNVPELVKPSKISLDGGIACATDSGGVHCWGQYGGWGSPISDFPNADFEGIIDISVTGHILAVLDENGVQYINMFTGTKIGYPGVFEGLINPSMISSSCVLDDSGVTCSSLSNYQIPEVPHLENPSYISAGSLNACAIDVGGVTCWGQRPEFLNIPNLDGAYSLDVSRWIVCALDTNGLNCWGGLDSIVLNSKIVPLLIDPDNDGVSNQNGEDVFPFDSSEWFDTDMDGVGDNADADDDGDNVIDSLDPFPLDGRYTKDTDSDGLPDAYETANGLNPNDASDTSTDTDGDDLTVLEEFGYGTSDSNTDSDFDTLPDGWEVANERDPMISDYQLSALFGRTCAIDDDGVKCWGSVSHESDTVPTDLVNPVAVAVGSWYTCAIHDNGLNCWGDNNYGQATVPTDLVNPVTVAAGSRNTCAIDDNGVRCWGYDSLGAFSVPTDLMNPVAVEVNYQHICALDDNGVHCWGSASRGETTVPAGLENPLAVTTSSGSTCAIDDNGVQCWGGGNTFGQTTVPAGLVNPVDVAAGNFHTCALDDNGVQCWGDNDDGQTTVPIGLVNPVSLAAGNFHTCALDDNGVQCWGRNDDGQTQLPSSLIFDPDGDGVTNQNGLDAFPFDATESADTDSDGAGNNADTDDDNDGVLDTEDALPLDATETVDTDGDGTGDNGDNCPAANPDQTDTDSDGFGNVCDGDDDNDGSLDTEDAFPLDAAETIDADGDGIGNNADTDDDNDGLNDVADAFPLDATEQADSDGDGVGNNADVFPFDASETIDTDADGIGNNSDTDDDGDNILDNDDGFPLNSLYSKDSDSDGMPDAWETRYGLNPNDPSDATSDQDNDGVSALDEFLAGTIPSGSIDLDGNEKYDALTDGLLLLRGMFGLDGSALITGTVASDATYTESVDIESRIATLGDLADIDGNGEIDALTDGLLTLRYLFGLQGDTLINGVVADDATRTTAEEIEAHLETLMPSL